MRTSEGRGAPHVQAASADPRRRWATIVIRVFWIFSFRVMSVFCVWFYVTTNMRRVVVPLRLLSMLSIALLRSFRSRVRCLSARALSRGGDCGHGKRERKLLLLLILLLRTCHDIF